jgi:peroxiredoxin
MIDVKTAVFSSDFSVNDVSDRLIRLSDYRGKKNVVLVFNRGLG